MIFDIEYMIQTLFSYHIFSRMQKLVLGNDYDPTDSFVKFGSYLKERLKREMKVVIPKSRHPHVMR